MKKTKYIDANKLIESFGDQFYDVCDDVKETLGFSFSAIERTIKDAPDADVAPIRHGEWIYVRDSLWYNRRIYRCSLCEKTFPGTPPYCPECGAMMDS